MKRQEGSHFRGFRSFDNWHEFSSVRSRQNLYLCTNADFEEAAPEKWFPIAISPALSHPEIVALTSPRRLRIHISHLIHFLDYTTKLEVEIVNEAVALMVHGSLSRYFNSSDHQIALKLYTDEGYHALFSRQQADQVSNHFRIERHDALRIRLLVQFIEQCPESMRDLSVFLVAFVSETVITKELALLNRQAIVPPVFAMLRDHLSDEARHSIFFAASFVKLISKLTEVEQSFAVDALSKIITLFYCPDSPFLRSLLADCPTACARLLTDLEQPASRRGCDIASLTLETIKHTGLLASARHVQLFKERGLLG